LRASGSGRRPGAVALALSALSGLSWVLAGPDVDLWPLAYVGLVPLLVAVDRAPTLRRAALYGWIAGLVANAGGFYWITELLTRHAAMPWILGVLALLALAAYQAVVFLLFAVTVRRIRTISTISSGGSGGSVGPAEREAGAAPLPMVLLAPLAMVTFELLVPFIFPWYLAVVQAWVAPVIQIAELTGPLGVTAVIAAVNGGLYDAVTAAGRRRRLACAAAAVAVLAAVLAGGWMRMAQIETRRQAAPALRVGLVQSNQPMERDQDGQAQLRDLQRVSADLEDQGAELLVWPESGYPYAWPRDAAADMPPGNPYRIRGDFTSPLVLGAVTVSGDAGEPPHNSALLLDRSDAIAARYDKIHLLVFGEYIPGLETFPFVRALLPEAAGHFAAGREITTFPLAARGGAYRLGPMICYEDILPGFGRVLAGQRPHLLVNITNDAWFGDSAEPWQHLALSVFRAVEARADLVRAVNPGVTAFVDATGRVRARTYVIDPARDPRGADGILVEVALMEAGHTFYARHGDLFGGACVAATLALALVWPWALRRRQRRRARAGAGAAASPAAIVVG
jgi:apolipoprotein N-acyltransferase